MKLFDAIVNVKKFATDLFVVGEQYNVTSDITVTAHAGAMNTMPNKLWSAKEGIASGADIIEVDVTARRNGSFVLAHKSVAKDNEGVPFEYLLKLLRGNNIRLNIDLKSFDNLDVIQNMIEERGLLERVFFTGVGENEVEKVKKTAPKIPTYLNASPELKSINDVGYVKAFADKVSECGVIGLNCNYKRLNKMIVDAVHEKGLLVSAWTVNNERAMKVVLDMGVDNITTKNPLLLNSLIKR